MISFFTLISKRIFEGYQQVVPLSFLLYQAKMTAVSYSVTESIHRRYGRIIQLVYDYEENEEQYELDLLTQKHEHLPKYRRYRAIIQRDGYERLIEAYVSDIDKFSFENFVCILRPIMMGTYVNDELDRAFSLLAKNHSNTIDLYELADFLSIIHSEITPGVLIHYLSKGDIRTNQQLDFDQFTDVVLRGIGRDIVCGHIFSDQ